MSRREWFIIVVFVIIAFWVEYIQNSICYARKTDEIHQCSHQLMDASVSIHKKTERNLKETQHAISNSEDREKFELIAENLELMWQNEKLIRELLNMFNLLRGREMPLSRPSGKTNI